MFEQLRQDVFEANMKLAAHGLAPLTWGNASGIDRSAGIVAIKASGIPYEEMSPEDLVLLDLDGKVVEGSRRPSSDTATHLVLYRAFSEIGGVAHTHSAAATAWAQARRSIPPLGTTHADSFYGSVPCTPLLSREEIEGEYTKNTGYLIVKTFAGIRPLDIPAVLVAGHGPFTWGKNAAQAVENSVILEEVAKIALNTLTLDPAAPYMQQELLDRHYFRKHGPGATYGQKSDAGSPKK